MTSKSSYYYGGVGEAPLDIAIPVRLITYIAMGLTVIGGAPYLFSIMGI